MSGAADRQPRIRVLVADDERMFRHALTQLLAMDSGIEIVGEAADGREALALAADRRADVILMDIAMPRLDGIEATRAIAAQCPGAKVVILTIYTDDDKVFQALQAGAAGYVLKDAAPEETLRAVYAVARGEGILSPSLVGRVMREFARLTGGWNPNIQGFADLSPRERDVLALLGEGLRNQDIAARLSIAEKTVKHHVSSILSKLQLNHRTEAALLASRAGLAAPRKG